MEITGNEQIMYYPGFDYVGRKGEYSAKVADTALPTIVQLVQARAVADGQWSIDNGFVGDNEDAMRKMMAFASDEKNIRQCVNHIYKNGEEHTRTVEWICRDMANASKWAHGTSDRD